jgi:signal transduction histidine kinase/ligand-binding sensor domain-containing protein
MQKNKIILLVLFFICGKALSQQYPFIQYTLKDGLVYNRCRFMYQDSKGLLYISTFGGLSVYDGSRFTNYTTREGLANNFIEDIVEMGNDSLWIISNGSPIQYLKNGRIQKLNTLEGFVPSITKTIRLKNGKLYALADEGLFLYEHNRFLKVDLHNNNTGKDPLCFFTDAAESGNKLFIVTDWRSAVFGGAGRIVVYDFDSKRVVQSKPLYANTIAQSPAGDVFVSTIGGIKKINQQALLRDSIVLQKLPPAYHAAEELHATNLFFDRQHNLWIGSTTGLLKIDTAGNTKTFTQENGLPVNIISSVFQDNENTMWFINEQTGICKLTSINFELYKDIQKGFFPTDIYANNNSDSVWLLDAGNNKLLLKDGMGTKTFQLAGQLSNPPARAFATDGHCNYLTDLFNIYQCSFPKNNSIRLTKLYADSNRNENASFNCIKPDGYGNLVATTQNITVILKNGQTIIYPLGYYADEFALTSNNYLWVITRAVKLFVFRIHPEDPAHYLELLKVFEHELPKMAPRSIAATKNGEVWIGTRDAGLYCLSFDGLNLRSLVNINTHDGLSDNFISYLDMDKNDVLWTCSPAGFDKLEKQNGKIQVENITLSNAVYQHIFKTQTTRSGDHWLMIVGGVIKIAPEKNIATNFQSKILFRQISQNGTSIDPASTSGSFSYKNNNLSFTVAAPGFIDERQTRFSYLLEGSGQKGWSEPTSQGLINLVNLSPGKYILKVKSSFINHRYADTEIAYSFIINPPWWQTWWFNTLLVLMGGLTTVLVIRNYYQRRFRKVRAVFEKEQAIEKERTRIATDMHDDLGAGLSTIRFLSEKVKRNTFSPVTKEDIDKIQYTSNELIDKMNEIIWSMNEKNNSLEDLVFFLRSYAMEYCENNNLACTISLPEEVPGFVVSGVTRRNVFLTVKESLHNIVKHARAENINLTIEVSEDLVITVKDNGKGMKENWKTSGGNGLKNMHKRMESVGGSLHILNEQGIRTTIKVPLNATV